MAFKALKPTQSRRTTTTTTKTKTYKVGIRFQDNCWIEDVSHQALAVLYSDDNTLEGDLTSVDVATEENLHNLYEPVPNKGTNKETLKRCLKTPGEDARLADYFDVIAGTSTGGQTLLFQLLTSRYFNLPSFPRIR
ncbi:hypothetical protein JHK85_002259 [Glycine max]|nr:hypothetical protein JHK85_002259 [Glycine max]